MRWTRTGLALAAVALAGCGQGVVAGTAPDPGVAPYDGPMHVPVTHQDHASVRERSGAAARALECEHEPYLGGTGDYDSGLTTVQGAPEDALADFFAEEWFSSLPAEGYRVEREDDGRVLLSYDVAGRTRVAFVVADGTRDFTGDVGWGVETWAQCDPAELPAEVTDGLGIGVWHDESGARVPVTRVRSGPGPEHCDWQDITFLDLGTGRDTRQFLRDVDGELADLLVTTFDPDATLPRDARDTGLSREGRHLWLAADGTAAYLVDTDDPDHVERWPASAEPIACA